jgi:hypothetical protein
MKVVFLDFDGVINSDPYLRQVRENGLLQGWGFKDETDRHMLDPARIGLLNSVLDRTGANIVISSSWRNIYTQEEMTGFLRLQGLAYPERIIDVTPSTRDLDTAKKLNVPLGHNMHRGELIQAWLKEHPEVTKYVSLDDDPGAGEAGTVWIETDFMVGLTPEIADKAVEILNADESAG